MMMKAILGRVAFIMYNNEPIIDLYNIVSSVESNSTSVSASSCVNENWCRNWIAI